MSTIALSFLQFFKLGSDQTVCETHAYFFPKGIKKGERKSPPEEAEVSIVPGGSGVGFTPTFVECDEGRIVIHDGGKTTPVRTAELNTNPDFAKVLEEVKSDEKGTLVFLIRDDGLSTYHTARNFANTKGVRNGKLPVIGDGRIDLSYFKKQAKNS